ncbi:hypothetical protein KDJ21_017655 [Metabacillus litoralis]|uniref:hypothetical protein n=1 Tax=Metabacillus TaxID=2675233 RepID=UPI001B989C99|nr:hypothetical protein [Metabacillus litoralis]UHA58647.1 hypothetical protein KDJ21_017655 [Metabacillus litoralis]
MKYRKKRKLFYSVGCLMQYCCQSAGTWDQVKELTADIVAWKRMNFSVSDYSGCKLT